MPIDRALCRLASALAAFTLVACASHAARATTASGQDAAPAATRAPARRNANVISAAELADPAIASLDVLDAVRHLRPAFLNFRGSGSVSNPDEGRVHASIDGSGVTSVDELRAIRASEVVEIRYLSATDAATRFGIQAARAPVIVVSRR